MSRRKPTGGSIRLKPGTGKFLALTKPEALEIARRFKTRGEVIEHVKSEAEVSGVKVGSPQFDSRVFRIMRAMRFIITSAEEKEKNKGKKEREAKEKVSHAKNVAELRELLAEFKRRPKGKPKAKAKAKGKPKPKPKKRKK